MSCRLKGDISRGLSQSPGTAMPTRTNYQLKPGTAVPWPSVSQSPGTAVSGDRHANEDEPYSGTAMSRSRRAESSKRPGTAISPTSNARNHQWDRPSQPCPGREAELFGDRQIPNPLA
ncbi:hypothetical protein THAOC_08649, partial [Thalassiosira oceanica]